MKKMMYLMPLCLALWGGLSATLEIALPLIALFISPQFINRRVQLSDQQFYRIGDFISVAIVVVLVFGYITGFSNRPIFVILQWLPLFYAPALFAQLFSTRERLPLGTLFYSIRGANKSASNPDIDFRLTYSGICLLAAGAARIHTPLYFACSSAIIVFILWQIRNKQSPKAVWLAAISLCLLFSFFGYQRLSQAHQQLEQQMISWLSEMMLDPYKNITSIGDIGKLKLSNQIIMRVKTQRPLLLHQASYDRYLNQSWYASVRGFRPFKNIPTTPNEQRLSIMQTLKSKDILALPPGTTSITGLNSQSLYLNPFGTIRIDNNSGLRDFSVSYTGRFQTGGGHYDRQIPKQHLPWLEQIVTPLIAKDSQQTTVDNIKAFFRNGFFYTLFNDSAQNSDQALKDFMLNRKAGHCEYYAVASVFMLRYAGIPARLANGYAVQEYDPEEQLFLVRSRHAHAWAWALIDGRWKAVDTTPGTWLDMETEHISVWQSIYDRVSRYIFQFNRWRIKQQEKDYRNILLSLLAVLSIVLIYRLNKNRNLIVKNQTNLFKNSNCSYHQGLDSEFFLIEQHFNDTQLARAKKESLQCWIQRIAQPDLAPMLALHLRYRFDPEGLDIEQRNQLNQLVFNWLEENRQ